MGHERAVGSRTTYRLLSTVWSWRYANDAMMPKPGQGRRKERRLGTHLPREDGVTLVMYGASDATAELRLFQRMSPQLRQSELHPAVR